MTIQEARQQVDMNSVPKANIDRLMKAMVDMMHDIRRSRPDEWARLYEDGKATIARIEAKAAK